jgi:hypothetical protein
MFFLLRLLSAWTIAGGILVLAGVYSPPVRMAILVLSGMATVVALRNWRPRLPKITTPSIRLWSGFGLAIMAAVILSSAATTAPLRSPWSVVSGAFFAIFTLLSCFAVATSRADRRRQETMWLVASIVALQGLVALLVYPLGFGFDHFLHAASERLIATSGTLSPPPLFYSGHYGLVVLLGDLFPVAISMIDRMIVPLLAAGLLVPLAHKTFQTNRSLLVFLIVPSLPIAVSTPQALGFVFALACILLLTQRRFGDALLLAFAATFAQPLAGIPIITATCASYLWERHKQIPSWIISALGIAAIPTSFAVASMILPQLSLGASWNPGRIGVLLSSWWAPLTAYRVGDFSHADALSIAAPWFVVLWIVLAIIGYADAQRRNNRTNSLLLPPMLIPLLASFLVATTITIPSQLPQEQLDFARRLLQLSALGALPFAAAGLEAVFRRSRPHRTWLVVVVLVGVLSTATLTLAYPRDDIQSRSGLWSVSENDISAVRSIVDDAGAKPFVVLANQMLGAAAVQEFGFAPNHLLADGNEVMSFPLPAGGPIAQQFWTYVNQPLTPCDQEHHGTPLCFSRAPIDDAMRLVGASRTYVVLHDYWRSYPELVKLTQSLTEHEIGSFTHLRVFRFETEM